MRKKLNSSQLFFLEKFFSRNLTRRSLRMSVTYFARTFSHFAQYFLTGDWPYTGINDIVHQLLILNTGKAVPVSSIPAKILKSNSYIFVPMLHRILNGNIAQNSFPDKLKEGDIHKKDYVSLKTNYRPITCLPSISKTFERILESQIKEFSSSFLHPYICGFRKKL